MKPERPPVIGEDGELVNPDTSINPDDYASYVQTHVHRDPLLFRIREHVSYYGCAYLFVGAAVLTLILISVMTGSSIFMIAIGVLVPLGYMALMASSPKNGGR